MTWFACSEPERPTDGLVVWHYGGQCTGCRVKAAFLARLWPNDSNVQWLVGMVDPSGAMGSLL